VRRVFWSEQADSDYDNRIIGPIEAVNSRAATKLAGEIHGAIAILRDRPIGRPGRVAGTYEKLVVGRPYIIAYALQPRPGYPDDLVILRIIHTARNWPPGRWPD